MAAQVAPGIAGVLPETGTTLPSAMAKPSWPVKAEIVLLMSGIAGALFMLLVLLNWRALPAQVSESFRGGTLGAQGCRLSSVLDHLCVLGLPELIL